MDELRNREVVRTANNPTGDVAEALVARFFDGERGSFSQKGWDVLGPDGERIQVKAIRITDRNARTRKNLSAIRDTDYDSVVVVVFNADFTVREALKFPRSTVEELFEHRDYVNGRIIVMGPRLLDHPTVERLDFTALT